MTRAWMLRRTTVFLVLAVVAFGGSQPVVAEEDPLAPAMEAASSAAGVELDFFPPAVARSATGHTDVATLGDDWHCSKLSGDACASSTTSHSCWPRYDGRQSSCSALDWNNGPSAVGNPAYFRALGVGPCSGSCSAYVSVTVRQRVDGCHVLQVDLVDRRFNTVRGRLVFQHIVRSTSLASSWTVPVATEGVFTNLYLGSMVSESAEAGCPWTGAHVHEDDDTSSYWRGWNINRFNNADLQKFEVDSYSNWTRYIRW